MVIQTILGSWDRATASGNNIVSRLAIDLASSESAESFMTFNTSYKVKFLLSPPLMLLGYWSFRHLCRG
jgi:hypothetical protein